MTIGFIGLGIMGSAMAANLIDAGHTLRVYNRTKEKAAPLTEAGATWAENPRQAVEGCEITISMLAHPQAVEDVAFGADGVLEALPEGAPWIDCSTVNPSFSQRMVDAAKDRGHAYIDAPVAGTKPQAQAGELVFFVGGSEAAPYSALFEVMGARVVYLGEPTRGVALKMVVNALLATSMAAFSEATALGIALGLPRELLLNALIGGPVTAPFLASKREMMSAGEYDTHFPLRWMHKDLHLAATTAYEVGAPGFLTGTAEQMFREAAQAGFADSDFSALYSYFNPR